MLLEIAQAGSFLLCILSLYSVLITAFFTPNTSWQQRLSLGLGRLAIAACVSLASGLLFSLRTRPRSGRRMPLWTTLPVRVFLWASILLTVLFSIAWYLRCGNPDSFHLRLDCS